MLVVLLLSTALPLAIADRPIAFWNHAELNGLPYDTGCGVSEPFWQSACAVAQAKFKKSVPEEGCTAGCGDAIWVFFLELFVVSRGCLPCAAVGNTSNFVTELSLISGCLVGKVAVALTLVIFNLHGIPAASRSEQARNSVPLAMHALDLAAACGDKALLPVIGISYNQVEYLLNQMVFNFSRNVTSHFKRFRKHSRRLVFDIGIGEGDDSIHYLQQGYRVVAVDSIASQVALLQAKVTELPKRKYPSSNLVALHEQIGSPDDTATIACGELVRRFGVPYYLKIDIEGYDLSCLRTLASGSLPQFVSVELMTVDSPCCRQAREIVRHLLILGYYKMKLVRQRLYNALLGSDGMGLSPQSGSGPFGHDAIDFQHGRLWRDVSNVEVMLGNRQELFWDQEVNVHAEWYDLHACRNC